MKILSLIILLTFASIASATQTKEYCGKRDGTAGNAILVDKKNNEIFTFSEQGSSDVLLVQADDLIGKDKKGQEGTQNGIEYCVTAELDKTGTPKKIIKAHRVK
jgi:hypothetical protein